MSQKKNVAPKKQTIAKEQAESVVIIRPGQPDGGMDVPYLCQKDLLAIIGTADPTRQAAPYEDKNFEIWGVAVATSYPDVKRIDVQFEMHTDGYWKKDPNVAKRLSEAKVPLFMQQHWDEFPTSVTFPLKIVEKYRPYFTSSIAYMLALAYHSFVMVERPKHVALFGIHMSAGEEYGEQRPCCEYWLGRMEGAGMDIEPSQGGSLLISSGTYGYENYNPICMDFRQRIADIQGGMQESQQKISEWQAQFHRNAGAKIEAEYWLRKIQRGEFVR